MKVSKEWLQTHIDAPLPETTTLVEGITFHAFEVESVEEKNGDTVLDIKVLPDRAHDCLSHFGIAREIAAIFNLPLKPFSFSPLPAGQLQLPIEIQSDLCRRYMAVMVRGVIVKESPEWLKKRLEAIGARSINNVVDATNYVMFNLGQPLHTYDLAKVEKGIVVRAARIGEKFITLSDEECELNEGELIITDYLAPIGLAGIKGGKSAEVSEETKDILLEAGNFEPVTVRRAARRLSLVTDAAKRFENDFTPLYAEYGMQAVVALITEIAGGTVEGVFDHYPNKVAPWEVKVTAKDIQRLLGNSCTLATIESVYKRYGYRYSIDKETITIVPPVERLDLKGAHDVAEDVGKLMGYENISPLPLPESMSPLINDSFARMLRAKALLSEQGYYEVMTYSFTKKGQIYIAYASKDKAALRTNLLDGLRESYTLNKQNAALLNIKELKLFEIGTVFLEDKEEVRVATIDAKGEKEMLLEEFIPEAQQQYPVFAPSENTTFKMWSLFPYIVRDVAVWIKEGEQEKLKTIVGTFAKEHAAAGPFLFDTFTKEEKISVAYRFIFQSYEKTLTIEEVNKTMETLYENFKKEGFEIR